MTTEEWKPARVVRIDREITHEEEREKTLDRDLKECRQRLVDMRAERAREMGPQQATVNWGGASE